MISSEKSVKWEYEKQMNQQIDSQNKTIQQLTYIVNSITKRIDQSQLEWKNMHFANMEEYKQSQVYVQSEHLEWLEKYRGKEGEIKSIGLILYYQFLKFIIGMFVVLTILCIPVFIIELKGNGLLQYSSAQIISSLFLKLTLANQKYYRYDNLFSEEVTEIQFNKNIVIITDVIGIVIMLIAIVWWKVRSYGFIADYIAKSPAPWLYTLEVSNIPQNITATEIKKHFEYFGQVKQVEPIRNHQSNLIRMKALVNLIHQYKLSNHSSKQLFKQINQFYLELADTYLTNPIPSIKSAFIAFENIQTRNRTYQLYKYKVNLQKLVVGNDIPIVQKCYIEPLTINWQNYHLRSSYHTKMNICQCMLILVMLFVIVLALFLLNVNSNQLRTSIKKYTSSTRSDLQYLDLSDQQVVYSFCANLTFQKFKWSYYHVCAEYFDNYTNQFMLMVLFSMLVVVINLLTNRILRQLVEFRRYKTIAQKNNFLITAIFCFSLINSGILIVLMRGNNIGPALCWVVTKILHFKEGTLSVQIFQQFNRKWYITIGSQLVFNYIITLVICPILYIFKYWIKSLLNKKKPFNELDFDYCTFYAMSLKAIFFTLFYSHAMPILYPLTIASIIVQYLVAKLIIRKFVREPIFFDSTANETVMRILPYGLILHTFLAIVFINVDEIFPNKSSYMNMNAPWIYTNLMKFQKGYIHSITLLILLVFTIYRDLFYKLVIDFIVPFQTSQTKTFTEIGRNPSFLSSYHMKDNPRYKIIAYAMDLFESHMKIISDRTPSLQNFKNVKVDAIIQHQVPKSMQSMEIIPQPKQFQY